MYIYIYIHTHICIPLDGRLWGGSGAARPSRFAGVEDVNLGRHGDRSQLRSQSDIHYGGCSGREVQWIGVVLFSKIVYNTIQIMGTDHRHPKGDLSLL